jgi:hypothetical protein
VRRLLLSAIALAAGFAAWSMIGPSASIRFAAFGQDKQRNLGPQYDARGALLRPQNFETWIFVGSSTGLTYEPGMPVNGGGEFHNVYIRPESYREYVRTGIFPEETMLVLALYPPERNVSPAKAGYFEGDLEGMAVAVKDHAHFREGWAYFNFGGVHDLKTKAMANPKQACYDCHVKHAADDNVFVQFYPVLRPVIRAHRSATQP